LTSPRGLPAELPLYSISKGDIRKDANYHAPMTLIGRTSMREMTFALEVGTQDGYGLSLVDISCFNVHIQDMRSRRWSRRGREQ
jgi:hypothetical protein